MVKINTGHLKMWTHKYFAPHTHSDEEKTLKINLGYPVQEFFDILTQTPRLSSAFEGTWFTLLLELTVALILGNLPTI